MVYKVFVLIPIRAVCAEGYYAGAVRDAGGLVPSIHDTFYRHIYQLSIDSYEVLGRSWYEGMWRETMEGEVKPAVAAPHASETLREYNAGDWLSRYTSLCPLD